MILCKIGYQEFLIPEEHALSFAQIMSNVYPVTIEYKDTKHYIIDSEYQQVTMEKADKPYITREEWKELNKPKAVPAQEEPPPSNPEAYPDTPF